MTFNACCASSLNAEGKNMGRCMLDDFTSKLSRLQYFCFHSFGLKLCFELCHNSQGFAGGDAAKGISVSDLKEAKRESPLTCRTGLHCWRFD